MNAATVPRPQPTVAEPHPERYSYLAAVEGDYPALCGNPRCGPCKVSAAAWAAEDAAAEARQRTRAATWRTEPGPSVPRPLPDDADPLGWQDRALCAQTDPEAFFPEKGGSVRPAKRVCRSCPVRSECLDYALENDERFGVWGGLSERERHRIKRQAG